MSELIQIACQNCFNAEAEMQDDGGTYLCWDCHNHSGAARTCDNCVRDGVQLVDRKCIWCNKDNDFIHFEARK